jgi:pimeloyl-ACP methyl ester carboxylesterase
MEVILSGSGTVKTSGATIYYKLRGQGPFLLIIQGAGGDANLTDDLVSHLEDHFTVITYDRRGLSRSKQDDDSSVVTLQSQSEDIHTLIKKISSDPIFIFATSIGAIMALDFFERYPSQIQQLLVHEPPIAALLPKEEHVAINEQLINIESIYKEKGFSAAIGQLTKITGIDPTDREKDAAPVLPTAQQIANLNFYFQHELTAGREFVPDMNALVLHGNKLIVAAGEKTKDLWTHRCAQILARAIDADMIGLPGPHNGPTAYPAAFAEALTRIFT